GFGVAAMLVSKISAQAVFQFLIDASGALMLLIYLIVACAEIAVRRRLEAEKSPRLTVRMWFYPYGSYLTVAAILAILVAMAFTPALLSQLTASLGVLALVLVLYVGIRRRMGAAKIGVAPMKP
ncbi:MAG: hypothetical protein ABI306_02430, partial [Caulobacteraceae bacterium]